jgi:hypothetical protein
MQLLISAGVIQPGGEQHSSLSSLAETARAAQTVRTSAPAAPTPVK